jgi:hypothetical protein
MSFRPSVRLPGVFRGRYRRHAFGGCGCSTFLLLCILGFVALTFARGLAR